MSDLTSRHTEVRIDDMDAGFGGHFIRARASLGVSSFGMSVLDFPPDFDGYPEHSHQADRQEEVFLVLTGSMTLLVDGEPIALDRENMVRVDWQARRKVIAGPEGVRFLVLGGRPGYAYEPSPFSALGAPDDARRSGPAAAGRP